MLSAPERVMLSALERIMLSAPDMLKKSSQLPSPGTEGVRITARERVRITAIDLTSYCLNVERTAPSPLVLKGRGLGSLPLILRVTV
jgi:hypothetical protein